MKNCTKINTSIECGVKMYSSNDEGKKINSTTLIKSLVESLRYLTCIRLDIFFRVGLMSRFMEIPTMTNFKALK
jgi:hypothetical protein